MIGYYNYSVILTYTGLISAVVGMNKALHGNITSAILFLMFCGLCDMFDGSIARTCKRCDDAKSFGIQIDSLCDLVCFGVFPAVIGFGLGIESSLGIACLAFFVLAAVIRLAFYNVQEINRVNEHGEKRKYYVGLPVTAIALIVPIFFIANIKTKISLVHYYHFLLLAVGILNISKFKIKKPYTHGLAVLATCGAVAFFIVLRYGAFILC